MKTGELDDSLSGEFLVGCGSSYKKNDSTYQPCREIGGEIRSGPFFRNHGILPEVTVFLLNHLKRRYKNSEDVGLDGKSIQKFGNISCTDLVGFSSILPNLREIIQLMQVEFQKTTYLDPPFGCQISAPRSVFGGFFGAQISDPWRIQV